MLILMNNLQRRKHSAYIQGHLKTGTKQNKAILEMTIGHTYQWQVVIEAISMPLSFWLRQ